MLCSDGITKTIAEENIRDIIYINSKVKKIVTSLIAEAIKNGESDNITCAVFKKGK